MPNATLRFEIITESYRDALVNAVTYLSAVFSEQPGAFHAKLLV